MTPFPRDIEFANAGMRGGKQHIVLTAPFEAETSLGRIVAHKGFVSDGASIPQAAQSIAGDRFDYIKEATIHDWLYSPHNDSYDRAESDYILRELMYNVGWPIWKVNAFYLAVRIGGWRSFKAKL